MPETTPATATVLPALPTLSAQAERLIELGVHELAGLSVGELRTFADSAEAAKSAEVPVGSDSDTDSDTGGDTGGDSEGDGALLAIHPDLVPASALAPLLRRNGKPGFVVIDMPDVDGFAPCGVELPDTRLYLVTGLDRGDHMANWSPDEALLTTKEDRTLLLLTEGIHWVLQQPEVLERNHCFMTIGSRLRKANGTLDARTPAIWISNGTGRDGRERRDAPKVGWCWWGNRHTWLGFASATSRRVQDS